MKMEQILMPKLGESVTEGTVVKWLVNEGDKIEKFDTILEVETAKVIAEVPSTISGVLKNIIVKEGETVKVGSPICVIELQSDDNKISKDIKINDINKKENDNTQIISNHYIVKNNRYSPAVLTLAQKYGLNLNDIQGSGENNRITRKDLLKIIEKSNSNDKKSIAADNNKKSNYNKEIENINIQSNFIQESKGDVIFPLTTIRKTIAKKMLQSVHEIPHAWMSIEVDATNLVKLRNKIKEEFYNKEGYPITYFTFFVYEIIRALKKYPLINSIWKEDHILIKKDINISIAVASEKELFVPVIKNADTKNIKGIALEIYDLAKKAKNGKLNQDDIQGGTFTINNTGSFGSIKSMGIINYPQAAILQVEAIKKRPVILEDNLIAIRDIVNLCISIDHRILDGLEVGKFLSEVKNNIENIKDTVY